MKKVKKKKMYVVIGVFFIIIGLLLVWFHIPYSPVKSGFISDVNNLSEKVITNDDVFSEDDFLHLPDLLQKYIQYTGYIGTPKMSLMKIDYQDVDFVLGKDGKKLKINYTQYNYVDEPSRLAMIDTSLFGIPFQGYDYYNNGMGGMKGVIGKIITLFDQTGADMDKACLATFLAEALLMPTVLLQDYISFEELEPLKLKATITYWGQTTSGVFTFNENYEMISFYTEDRAMTDTDGTKTTLPWSAICGDYQESESGIKYPTTFKAVWHYPDEDFVYFDGRIDRLFYDIV